MKRVIIIDALNAYFRAYIVNPSLSSNGQPIGGYKGFLGILQKLAREMNPDEIVIAWDGAGGSARRLRLERLVVGKHDGADARSSPAPSSSSPAIGSSPSLPSSRASHRSFATSFESSASTSSPTKLSPKAC